MRRRPPALHCGSPRTCPVAIHGLLSRRLDGGPPLGHSESRYRSVGYGPGIRPSVVNLIRYSPVRAVM